MPFKPECAGTRVRVGSSAGVDKVGVSASAAEVFGVWPFVAFGEEFGGGSSMFPEGFFPAGSGIALKTIFEPDDGPPGPGPIGTDPGPPGPGPAPIGIF